MPAPKPRKPKATSEELVHELISLVRDQMKGQNEVLAMAMESQKASADILSKWMAMFTPSGAPLKSSTEDERARVKAEVEAETEWEPFDFSGELTPGDMN